MKSDGLRSPRLCVRLVVLVFLALFLAGVAVSIAGAQQRASGVATSIRGDGGTVRLPTNQNSTQAWHLYALQKYGLDRKYGFNLQTVPSATSQTTATAIQSKAAEVGLFGWIDIARMRQAGVNVVGVAPFLQWGADHIVVPVHAPYRNIGDLKGKRLGIFRRSNIDWILDQALATTVYNMNVERDLIVQEGAIGLLRGLMESGQLDATHMFNNLTPSMVATGKFRVMSQMRDIIQHLELPEIPGLVYGVSADYAASHPQNVRAFLAAYREAVQILRKDDDVWDELGRSNHMPDPAIALLREEMRVDLWTTFKPTTEADIGRVFDFLAARAGPDVLGFSELPAGLITLEFQ